MTHDPLCNPQDDYESFVASDGNRSLARRCDCDLISKVRQDERAKYVNDNCVWGQADCEPDCPSCTRMDELYKEWSTGDTEGQRYMLAKCIAVVEGVKAAHRMFPMTIHRTYTIAALRALQEKP